MEILAICILCIGLGGLLGSLKPTYHIIQFSDYQHTGWRVLLSMILIFILAFLSYLWILALHPVTPLKLGIAAIFCAGGTFVFVVTHMSKQTIARLKQMVQEKHYQASHDSLTGLPNRVFFYQEFDRLLESHHASFCCMILDVDDFKLINDSFGHEQGDCVLQTIGQRITNILPGGAMAARIGGDELAVLLPDSDIDDALNVTQAIVQQLEQPMSCGPFQNGIGISIGLAHYPDDGRDRKTLLLNADTAMYQAKRSARSYQIYHPDMRHIRTSSAN